MTCTSSILRLPRPHQTVRDPRIGTPLPPRLPRRRPDGVHTAELGASRHRSCCAAPTPAIGPVS